MYTVRPRLSNKFTLSEVVHDIDVELPWLLDQQPTCASLGVGVCLFRTCMEARAARWLGAGDCWYFEWRAPAFDRKRFWYSVQCFFLFLQLGPAKGTMGGILRRVSVHDLRYDFKLSETMPKYVPGFGSTCQER